MVLFLYLNTASVGRKTVALGPESREVVRARPVLLAVLVLLDFSSHIAAHTAREQLEILEHLETPILYTHTIKSIKKLY